MTYYYALLTGTIYRRDNTNRPVFPEMNVVPRQKLAKQPWTNPYQDELVSVRTILKTFALPVILRQLPRPIYW